MSGQSGAIGEDKINYIFAHSGNDTIYGSSGVNTIYGSVGDDTIFGEEGDDTLHGGDNDDSLTGGTGSDTLYGNSGADTLFGDSDSNQILSGGDDNDIFVLDFSHLDTNDIDGGSGNDEVDITGSYTLTSDTDFTTAASIPTNGVTNIEVLDLTALALGGSDTNEFIFTAAKVRELAGDSEDLEIQYR